MVDSAAFACVSLMEKIRGIDRLRSEGVKVPDRAGHYRVMCPKCEGGKSKEQSLSVEIDHKGARFMCHRGLCNWNGGYLNEIESGGNRVRQNTRAKRRDAFENARHRW